jgi:nucleoside-diphosphate-sugar epimerase
MYMNTVVATRNLLDAAGGQVRRICLVSSFAVYDTARMGRNALLDETSPTEATGVEKGPYALSKVKQEELFLSYQARFGFEHVIVRPGVIYGPGGSPMSSRVGINALGFFFSLGNGCLLPLTQVRNCADAIVCATLRGEAGSIFNAVDDDLPTCGEYLRLYRRNVARVRVIPVPYPALMAMVKALGWYSRHSRGQIPAVLTPYIVRSMYRPLRYTNLRLKQIGWKQAVPTAAGVAESLAAARQAMSPKAS